MNTSSLHVLAEYHDCDAALLDDAERLRALMLAAVEAVGATVVQVVVHRFSPQGVTVLIAVEESHFSLHTWPEAAYAAADIYTCGDCDPRLALPVLRAGLSAGSDEVMEVERGAGPPGAGVKVLRHRADRGTLSPAHWVHEDQDGVAAASLSVDRLLHHSRSRFQEILLFENALYGTVLALDGVFQTSTLDEADYHELLVHPALCCVARPRRVLVIGGGDGGTAREVLRHPEVERCVMVEIDGEVVEACKQHLPAMGAWEDPRLELIIADGVRYLAEAAPGSFDVILLDGSDPVGPSAGLFDEAFYRACARALAPGGVMALQSEDYQTTAALFYEIQATLRRVFPRVHPYQGSVSLYGVGLWTWTLASVDRGPEHLDKARAEALAAEGRVYDAALHRAAFVLPLSVRRRLAALEP
ncbi:MAG: polyamine aminopropyltransferase [Alphaproteobacteria bacterium]|nr:polyamine aminopropyltransferase [Alphaproteobacteria bacterium]MCB9794109.1 polyamine aminopropyltransferase [Alphaproteobacteria bacterium]